jgi:hypothetical protein
LGVEEDFASIGGARSLAEEEMHRDSKFAVEMKKSSRAAAVRIGSCFQAQGFDEFLCGV